MFYSDIKYHKARKQHSCNFCAEPILPGQTYASQFVTDGADTWYIKEHVHCHAIFQNRCNKCPFPDTDCFTDDCVTGAIEDAACDVCEKKDSCDRWESRKCETAWKIIKDKYGNKE